jgi:hypothetical protein
VASEKFIKAQIGIAVGGMIAFSIWQTALRQPDPIQQKKDATAAVSKILRPTSTQTKPLGPKEAMATSKR